MKTRISVAALMLAAGQTVTWGRACASALLLAGGSSVVGQTSECVRPSPTGGFSGLIFDRTDALNLCPSVGVAGRSNDENVMVFAWGSATIQFHGGSPTVPASPAQGDMPAQIYMQMFDASGQSVAAAMPMVDYSGTRAWGHQYPSLAVERWDSPRDFSGTSNVALTFASDFSGFSKIAPSADSRIIYVSENGSTSNSGYSPDSPLPLTDGVTLFRSRDGYPDQLLLKRDDEFGISSSLTIDVCGRGDQEPAVMGAYGAGPRPILDAGANHVKLVSLTQSSSALSHLRFLGIDFTASEYSGQGVQDDEPVGISIVRHGEDVRIEDCRFVLLGGGVFLQVSQNPARDGSIVRRSIFWNISRVANSGGDGGVGIYQASYSNSLIEECLIGLDRTWAGEDPPVRALSQAIYNGEDGDDTQLVRGNISYNSGRGGIAARSGGLVERNVAVRSAQGFSAGYQGGTVDNKVTMRRNLAIESRDRHDTQSPPDALGWAYDLGPLDEATVVENIACHSTDGHGHMFHRFHSRGGGVLGVKTGIVEGNIAFNWLNADEGSTDFTTSIEGAPLQPGGAFSYADNVLIQLGDGEKHVGDAELVRSTTALPHSDIAIDGNVYYSERDGTSQAGEHWFQAPWGTYIAVTNWLANIDLNGVALDSQQAAAYFSDPWRDVGSYAGTLGLSATTEAFIEALHTRGPGEWDHALSAYGLVDYIRDGFDLPPLDRQLGPAACQGHFASMLATFNTADSPIQEVADDQPAACDKGRASIAYSWGEPLRVGYDGENVWYAFGTNAPAALSAETLATMPCVAAAADDHFVAVWLGEPAIPSFAGEWVLKCARIAPGATPTVHLLLNQIDAPHPVGNAPVQYGADDIVVPPSVACFDDGSFAVSYSDGERRWVALFSADATPVLNRTLLVDDGFAEFNHSLVAQGESLTDSAARLAVVAVSQPNSNEVWAPYVRTYKPAGNAGVGRFSRPYKIPMEEGYEDDLALGPAFAHPAAFRPDGKVVVTWWRQDITSTMNGTALGFSVVETGNSFCPADVNCDGNVNIADTSAFNSLYNAGNLVADFDCDGQLTSADYTAFQTAFAVGCQ